MTDLDIGKKYDVELELDKTRRLKIDFNTLCKAEEISGLSFLEFNAPLNGTRLRALVWAGIQYEPGERRLSLDEVGILVGEHIAEVMIKLMEAYDMAMPDAEEGAASENPQEAAMAPS
jgi:hypothetical protein